MKKIHVGFLLSYDYIKLKNSIPPVYKMADKIFIAVDHEFRTWAGQKFEVDAAFFDWFYTRNYFLAVFSPSKIKPSSSSASSGLSVMHCFAASRPCPNLVSL